MMNKMRIAMAVAGMAVFTAGTAQAQLTPAASPDCDWTMDASFPGFTPTPYACGGAFSGNSDQPATQALITTWLNAPAQAGDANGNTFSLDESYLGATTFGTTGTINFLSPIGGTFVLALKGSTTFSLYYFDVAAPITSLTYATDGTATNASGKAQDLSNVSMWTGLGGADPFCVGDDCVEVPEPTSFALYGMGLFGLGVMARRRRRQV